METSKRLDSNLSELTLSPEDFPVLTSAQRAGKLESRPNEAAFGSSMQGSFAYFDPATCSLKTSQDCLFQEWTEFSASWPAAGMMRNGKCFQREPLALPIVAIGSLSWLTPVARDWKGYTKRAGESICNQLRKIYGGSGTPNPNWIEWLMGFPVGWMAKPRSLDAATPSCPKLPSGSEAE